jgi:hypothetical protein
MHALALEKCAMESGRDEEFFETYEDARNAIADWARPVCVLPARLSCQNEAPDTRRGTYVQEHTPR